MLYSPAIEALCAAVEFVWTKYRFQEVRSYAIDYWNYLAFKRNSSGMRLAGFISLAASEHRRQGAFLP